MASEQYIGLAQGRDAALAALDAELEVMFEAMQSPAWKEAMQRGFDMPAEEMGRIAVEAARRKRG